MAFIEMDFASGGGMQYDLLWTNPSPTAQFNAQTISLNLSEYDYILVISEHANNLPKYPRSNVLVKVGGEKFQGLSASQDAIASGNGRSRYIQATTTGVQISNAIMNTSYSNSGVIPLYIFGIKDIGGLADYIEGIK